MIGRTLDHYRIVEIAGQGGMGEVYRARDEHLPRDVAIKVLSPGSIRDESVRNRFRTEAFTLSKLSHPNIGVVYDFNTQDGVDFIVMEYVTGETLRAKLSRGPLEEKELARLGTQLAEGLAAAHALGIVHRDLKPANIMITPDGRLKVLDFGLAKLIRLPERSDILGESTESQPGAGTPLYMAPEQLTGRIVDERTDIYAAGTLLYEMATGRHPFLRSGAIATAHETLHSTPQPPSLHAPLLSRRLEEIILKCLEKDPADRYQTAKDLAVDLRHVSVAGTGLTVSRPGSTPRSWRVAARAMLVAAVFAVAVFAAWWVYSGRGSHADLPSFESFRLTKGRHWEGHPALSPDGEKIAYVSSVSGNRDVYVVAARGGLPIQITQNPAADEDPAWFPDGTVTFSSRRSGQWDIWRATPPGSGETMILADAKQPAVSRDGKWLAFVRRSAAGYYRVGVVSLSEPTGERLLTGDGDGMWDHIDPAWSPDGRWISYGARHNLWVVPLAGGPARAMTRERQLDTEPSWCPDGTHIYFTSMRNGKQALWRLSLAGGPAQAVTTGTGAECHASVSVDGTRIAYESGSSERSLEIMNLDTGTETSLQTGENDFIAAISPDGSKVVFVSDQAGPDRDLWLQPLSSGLSSGLARPLTTREGIASLPQFSPDGNWIAYYRIVGDQRDIWTIPASGGRPIRFTDDPAADVDPAWSPDGKYLAFSSRRDGGDQIWLAPVSEGRAAGPARRLTSGRMSASAPAWSPDGKRIAFRGAQEDEADIYVIPVAGGQDPRRATFGAGAFQVRWDRKTGNLVVSGSWGEDSVSLRSLSPNGGPPRPLNYPVVIGPPEAMGPFDLSGDGRLVVFPRGSRKGNIWLMVARQGTF